MAFKSFLPRSPGSFAFRRSKETTRIVKRVLVHSQQTQATGDAAQATDVLADAKRYDQIPGPKGLPVIGTFLEYARNGGYKRMHEIQQQRCWEHGKIFREDIMSYRTVTISDPDDVQMLFRNEGKYPTREPVFPLWMQYKRERKQAHGVFSLTGEEWFKVRRILNMKMLKPHIVSEYCERLNGVTTDVLSRFKETRGGDNSVPNIKNELFKWSLESIGTVLFETRFGSFGKAPVDDAQEVIEATEKLFHVMLKVFVIPAWIDKLYRPKPFQEFYDCMDVLYDFADKCIQRKLQEIQRRVESGEDVVSEDSPEFLTFLVAREDIDSKEITANLVEILMAAIETTSNTSLWAMYCLAKNPAVQKQLYDEVRSVLEPGELPSPSSLQKMPFLKACVRETLRMFPVTIENARILSEDTVIRGYRIPPDVMVRIALYSMGRDPELFNDPLEYNPERWLRDDTKKSVYHAFASLPFGFGTRMCLGRRVAELEMYLLLSQISQNFWLECDEEVKPQYFSLLVPDREVKLKFVDR